MPRLNSRMGGRAVEGTGLENRQGRKSLVGSNPTPSATFKLCGQSARTESVGWRLRASGDLPRKSRRGRTVRRTAPPRCARCGGQREACCTAPVLSPRRCRRSNVHRSSLGRPESPASALNARAADGEHIDVALGGGSHVDLGARQAAPSANTSSFSRWIMLQSQRSSEAQRLLSPCARKQPARMSPPGAKRAKSASRSWVAERWRK